MSPAIRISIHALREEGDICRVALCIDFFNFYPRPPRGGRPLTALGYDRSRIISIHALREEGDVICFSSVLCFLLFLSTPSARRATTVRRGRTPPRQYFYPRPPRGGRPGARWSCGRRSVFLSTPSARRATRRLLLGREAGTISIHALREEGDSTDLSSAHNQL